MALKGFLEFSQGETLRIILVIIFAVGSLGSLAYFLSTGDNAFFNACKRDPTLPMCRGYDELSTQEYQAAEKSTEALVCAVNSVIEGSPWHGTVGDGGCNEYYAGPQLSGEPSPEELVKEYYSEKVLIRKKTDCSIACKEEEDDLCAGMPGCLVYSGEFMKRKLILDGVVPDKCECTIMIPNTPTVRCGNGNNDFACTVSNFNLPQEVTRAEDWIPKFGDPKYLVYWQKFPMSEDTWTFKDAWWMYAIIIGVSALPIPTWAAQGAKAGMKGISTAAKWGIREMKGAVTRSTSRTMMKIQLRAIERETRKKMLMALRKDFIEKLGLTYGNPNSVFKQGGKLVVGGGAMVTLKMLDVLDSWLGKLVPYNNRLLLKYAGKKEPEAFELERDVPVVLKYKSGLFKKSTPVLVLASPCYIDEMTVKLTDDVVCGTFINQDGDTACSDAYTKKSYYPSCFEPENYLMRRGGAGSNEAADPVIAEVIGFTKSIPEHIDIGGERATVILSDNMYATFDIRQGMNFNDAYVIFDTGSGLQKIPINEISVDESKKNEPVNLESDYIIGAATYGDAVLQIYFNKRVGGPGCEITPDGIRQLVTMTPSVWEQLTGASTTANFKGIDGVGCYGYTILADRCKKDLRDTDKICQILERFDEREVSEGTANTQFRYGSNWTISSVLSKIDSGLEGVSYWIELSDINGDYNIEKISINNGYGAVRNQFIDFIDLVGDERFESYSMKDCKMPEAVIITNVDKRNVDGDNYCYAQPTAGSLALKTGGIVVGTVGVVAAGVFTGGSALAILGTGAAAGLMEVFSMLTTKWPNAGGG